MANNEQDKVVEQVRQILSTGRIRKGLEGVFKDCVDKKWRNTNSAEQIEDMLAVILEFCERSNGRVNGKQLHGLMVDTIRTDDALANMVIAAAKSKKTSTDLMQFAQIIEVIGIMCTGGGYMVRGMMKNPDRRISSIATSVYTQFNKFQKFSKECNKACGSRATEEIVKYTRCIYGLNAISVAK